MSSPLRPGRPRSESESSKPARKRAAQGPLSAATPAAAGASGSIEVILTGCGSVADPDYIAALQSLQATGILHVAALVDGHDLPGHVFRHAFPNATLAASLESIVAAPGALVILATPPHLHASQAAASFKRGWHVLTMTPLARSSREAGLIIAGAERQERLLAVAFPRRFMPSIQYVRALCRDQLLGPLFSFEIHDGLPPATTVETSEGILLEAGVQALDTLIWCLGTPAIVRYADDAMGGVEANAFLELSFAENVRGRMHLSRDWPTTQTYEFLFERGIVRWSVAEPHKLAVQIANAPAALDATLAPVLLPGTPPAPSDAYSSIVENMAAQLRNVAAAIAGREPLRAPPSDAMTALYLVDDCYAHRTLLEQPWLSHNEAARARTLSTPTTIRRA